MATESSSSARRLLRRRITLGLLFCTVLGVSVIWHVVRRVTDDPDEFIAGTVNPHTESDYQSPPDDGFVGSAVCADCHAEIAAAYSTHPMARSTTAIDPTAEEVRLPPEQTRVFGEQRVYHVSLEEGAMLHHERMYDAAGELIYDQAVPMEYVVGSGQRAKAYVHRRGNLLFMSPLNWYSQSETWDLAPGYQPDDPRRFDRRVTDECLSCHAGRVAPEGRLKDAYETQAFHEMSIGCERCHGPGAAHVAWREAGGTDGEADPIVNPARLEPDQRESVCNQCHLVGAARVTRHDRSDLDFRPGQNLSEIWSVLVAGDAAEVEDRQIAVGHVQEMHSSRCYVGSDGAIGCTSCHDPHRVPAESERVAFYRRQCLECHAEHPCSLPQPERLAQDDSCITCHMPARNASNVNHVTQTDHRILSRPQSSGTASGELDSLELFGGMQGGLSPWEADRALGLGIWLHLTKKGRPRPAELASHLMRVLDDGPPDGAVLTVLAAMAMDANELSRAREYYERARVLPDAEETAIQGLLKIAYLSGEWEQAVEFADELIAIDPGHAGAYAMRADALVALGEVEAGIESARTSLRLNPTLLPVREWLARTLGEQGRIAEQQEQQEIIRRMQTAMPPQE